MSIRILQLDMHGEVKTSSRRKSFDEGDSSDHLIRTLPRLATFPSASAN
jgi:hypothetical protein